MASGPAICAYLMAGYPDLDRFPTLLRAVSHAADLVEIGVPFTDPMADGLTIQHAAEVALANGATLDYVFETLKGINLEHPHLLMGYYNPFLAYGLDALAESIAAVGTAGLIVPDLPPEEAGPLRGVLSPIGVALISLVTPATTEERLERIGAEAQGFLYAVTSTGVTGNHLEADHQTTDYLNRLRSVTERPILAGFGVRTSAHVRALAPHVDGVIVGSALLDSIDRGEPPADLIRNLRPDDPSASRH